MYTLKLKLNLIICVHLIKHRPVYSEEHMAPFSLYSWIIY